MGEEINIERIEVFHDGNEYFYQIDFRFSESGKSERSFIRKDALFALLCAAEKDFCARNIQLSGDIDPIKVLDV